MIWARHLNRAQRTGITVAACLTATGVFAADAAMQSCATAMLEQSIGGCSEIVSRGPGETSSSRATAHTNRGRDYLIQGELDRAFADLNEAIRLDPEHAHAYVHRGDFFQRQGAYEHALADLDQAIRLNPDLTLAYALRGRVYAEQDEFDDALADLNEAVHLDPTCADAYAFRALVYEVTGRTSHAMVDSEAALALMPDHKEAAEVKERIRAALATMPRSRLAMTKAAKTRAANERLVVDRR